MDSIRSKGLKKLGIGLVGAVLAGFAIAWLKTEDYVPTWYGLIIFGLPGAYGTSGLLELVSGVPFAELSQKWDELTGWQRGALGLSVVILCFGLLVGGLLILACLTT